MKPNVLSFTIKDKNAVYSAYMPHVQRGGVFIPTDKPYRLGDEIYLLLGLPDEPAKLPVSGKVIWITPPNAMGNRSQGIGIQLSEDENGRHAKAKLEGIIAGMAKSTRPTHTM